MPAKWEGFNSNPDLNIAAPPQGAPEGMDAGEYNAVDRYTMAAIKELGDEVRTGNAPGASGGIGLSTLKNMAQQAKEQVQITGGRIGGPAGAVPPDGTLLIDASKLALGSGAGDAAKVPQAVLPKVATAALADRLAQSPGAAGGYDLQALYDMMHPVGEVIFLDSGDDTNASAPTVPTGVSATWQAISGGRFLRFKNNPTENITRTGDATSATEVAGSHAHGGKTGSTALSIAQMPAHHHAQRGGSAAGSGSVKADAGSTVVNANDTADTGGGAGHDHTITSDGGHSHAITNLRPSWFAVSAYKRVA